MKKVVYFNQWFSSISDVISDLKEKYGNNVEFIASSKNPNHVYKNVVDRFIVEDWEEVKGDTEASMNNYFNFILNICDTYGVDIFFAKKYADFISSKRYELSMHNVFTVVEPEERLTRLLSKVDVYDYLKESDIEIGKHIPEYKRFSTTDREELLKFLKEYKSRKIKETWCLKKDIDEGGASYRKITRHKPNFSDLNMFRVNELHIDEVINMVKTANDEEISNLIFIELLDSPEISVDCYNSKNGFIALCRSKGKDRVQRIFYNKEIIDICKKIQNAYGFQFPFNVQFRVKSGKEADDIDSLRLLEINPRMSGGTYYGTLFNLNIAEACLLDLLNRSDEYNIDRFINFSDKKVTHVEKPVKLAE